MSNIKVYHSLKNEYNSSIVLIKSGIFYVTYDNDARIMNYIFNYVIKDGKVGFPIKIKDSIIEDLKKEELNVVIYEDEKTTEYKCDNNRYYYVLEEVTRKLNKEERMNNLIKLIELKIRQNEINFILIEEYLNGL